MAQTTTAALIDRLLLARTGFGLADHLQRLRADGRAWEHVAAGITQALGGDEQLTISRESARRWHAELVTVREPAA